MNYKKLLPFVSENFITFPLWEEGDYRPTLNIWLHLNELPTEIVNWEYLNIKDGFDIYCIVNFMKRESIELFDTKIESKAYYNVKFKISKQSENIEDSDIDELIDCAEFVIKYFKK